MIPIAASQRCEWCDPSFGCFNGRQQCCKQPLGRRADMPPTEALVHEVLQVIGENPSRQGLRETPARVVGAWREWFSGYQVDPQALLKCFEDGADGVDEMVLVRDIPVYSHCEHHMAPFFGVAHVAYIPNGRIVGLSKVPRLVDAFARRLQVQERLTNQVADAMWEYLQPRGVGVVLACRHLCMESRGIQRTGTSTITSALRGDIKDQPEARAEFLRLCNGSHT
jgi:GTP cyclohydrolase I